MSPKNAPCTSLTERRFFITQERSEETRLLAKPWPLYLTATVHLFAGLVHITSDPLTGGILAMQRAAATE